MLRFAAKTGEAAFVPARAATSHRFAQLALAETRLLWNACEFVLASQECPRVQDPLPEYGRGIEPEHVRERVEQLSSVRVRELVLCIAVMPCDRQSYKQTYRLNVVSQRLPEQIHSREHDKLISQRRRIGPVGEKHKKQRQRTPCSR